MLISRINDESEAAGVVEGIGGEGVSSHEYQTASQLFELMTQNRHFDENDEDSLTNQDLVLLYKNIDIGTRLTMSDATEVRRRKPNQHVETIVYNDEPESDSDISENFSTEDLQNVFKINQERLNLFDNGSFDNILCHKFGGLKIQTSDLTTEYNGQFLFKDPYIKEHLKNLNVMASCSEIEGVIPTSLLDYICSKRLEDNYNFYMDNIIKYVQRTIEQLKRISNGDYLTERAKEKWEEVNNKDTQENSNANVLATSTSIPLHVECKKKGNATWDDIVHSEMDVRSLSKILEKKIIVEIPNLICGSYRLFSKRFEDNLIISCKREKQDKNGEDESRVDVVLQLQRSQTGQVISNISSIMILQKLYACQDLQKPDILPITYKHSNDETIDHYDDHSGKENTVTLMECINDDNDHVDPEMDIKAVIEDDVTDMLEDHGSQNDGSNIETNDYPFSDTEYVLPYDTSSIQDSSDSNVALVVNLLDKPVHEESFKLMSPDELRVAMHKLNMQSSLPEESGEDLQLHVSSKKKSPTRVRIKSPYENKSYIMEEKKRKRLLEIREKRERKKMVLGENAKVRKPKYGKGAAITPQTSSSVTKLSITNKSFYNSIYGQSINEKTSKTKSSKDLKNRYQTIDVPVEQIQEEYFESPNLTPEKNSKKYINRSYYLDDAETEMMYLRMKQSENTDVRNSCSASASAVSNEFSANLTLLSQGVGPSDTDINKDEAVADEQTQSIEYNDVYNNSKDAGCSNDVPLQEIKVLENSSKVTNSRELDDTESKKHTVDCRKSIDKLYDLLNKLGKESITDLKTSTNKLNVRTVEKYNGSIIQDSDSGTSLKHHVTSSNPSCVSFVKTNPEIARSRAARKKPQAATVVPKAINSLKLQGPKLETDRLKKDRKRITINIPAKTVPENPLKAISQILHEFEKVQKTRQKSSPDAKHNKKVEIVATDGKTVISRQNSFRRTSQLDHPLRENGLDKKVTTTTNRDKRTRPLTPKEVCKIPQHTVTEDKNIDKLIKKKIADIIDEAKEARGEAVRGPPKLNRLNSLAQPKRSYVQAHSVEYQNKYGRNLMADRLQRLAAPPPPLTEPIIRNISSANSKYRARREATSNLSVKQPPNSVQPIDTTQSKRRSSSSSPRRKSAEPTLDSHKHNVDFATLENMKKMVAVESYLKNHYGRARSPQQSALRPSRVPPLPSDFDLVSATSTPPAEEANELGKKLHHIIDTMVTIISPLSSLPEGHESSPNISLWECTGEKSADNLSRDERTDSEYNINIRQAKKPQTGVANHDADKLEGVDEMSESPGALNLELRPLNSTAELEKLENALQNQISGAFQKRLRIKNLTLTPKQSLQQIFLLQSGDTASMLVKSTVSTLKHNKCTECLHDLKAVPVLSNSYLNWNLADIPIQISTVGYSFPLYQRNCRSKLDLKTLHVSKNAISEQGFFKKACNSDIISQCFQGVHQELKEEVARVDVEEIGILLKESTKVDVEEIGIILKEATQVDVEEIGALSEVTSDSAEINAETYDELLDDVFFNVNKLPKVVNKTVNVDEEKSPLTEKPAVYENNDAKQTGGSSTPDNVDYTTSLDMLVGLLNEIQKIACQNPGKQPNCTEPETILSNDAVLESDRFCNIVSVKSLDKLRQMESHPSIYSFYVSGEGSSRCIIADPEVTKPVFVDKEVNVNLSEKEFINTFTDVPSWSPIALTRSTNVTNSLGVISEPSNQSIIFNDFNTLYAKTFFSIQPIKRIVELPQASASSEKQKDSKKTDLNVCSKIVSPTFEVQRIRRNKNKIAHIEKKYTARALDFDSAINTINIKRDILVTVYSILVLTVFAALSFPDMAIFQE